MHAILKKEILAEIKTYGFNSAQNVNIGFTSNFDDL
jgi:hypothetical protein